MSPPRAFGPAVAAHHFIPRRRTWWRRLLRRPQVCNHCYAPETLHPRRAWVKSRPLGDDRYFRAGSDLFRMGW